MLQTTMTIESSDNQTIEERFIAQKPRDAEEYLDFAGRRARRKRTRKKEVGLLRSE